MYRYQAKIRLNNNAMNEVLRNDLLAADVIALRAIHGKEAVLGIEEKKLPGEELSDNEIRERVHFTYFRSDDEEKEKMFNAIYGPATIPVPTRLPEFVPAKIEKV